MFARKGMLPYKIEDGKRQQGLTGFIERKTEHSKKPEKMYLMIEKVSYPPYYEMFARTERKGWDSMGNELQNHKNIEKQKTLDNI